MFTYFRFFSFHLATASHKKVCKGKQGRNTRRSSSPRSEPEHAFRDVGKEKES